MDLSIRNKLGMLLDGSVKSKRSVVSFMNLPDKIKSTDKHHYHGLLKYDYSEFVYKNNKTKSKIKCLKCGNAFMQHMNHHLKGHGCPICAKLVRTKSLEQAIIDARKVHGNKYDYSEFVYKNAHTRRKIRCLKCGNEFMQNMHHHLKGNGCPICAGNARKTKEQVIIDARKVHGDKYDYSQFVYKNSYTKSKIRCLKCGNEFMQSMNSHLADRGCSICARNKTAKETYKDRQAIIYYVKFVHPDTKIEAWKIGITLKSPHERFSAEIQNGYKLDVIDTLIFEDGYTAFKLEQKIHRRFTNYRPYNNKTNKFLVREGNTEVFNKDILKPYGYDLNKLYIDLLIKEHTCKKK